MDTFTPEIRSIFQNGNSSGECISVVFDQDRQDLYKSSVILQIRGLASTAVTALPTTAVTFLITRNIQQPFYRSRCAQCESVTDSIVSSWTT